MPETGAVMVAGLLVQAEGTDLDRYLLVRDAASHGLSKQTREEEG